MKVLRNVLVNPRYLFLAVVVAIGIIIFATWLPNLQLIVSSLTSPFFTLGEKVNLLVSLTGSLETNFTLMSRLLLISSATLMGIQVALVSYYVRQRSKLEKDLGVSFIAMVMSLIGMGCASCGSIILATLVGFSAMSAIVRPLPLKGQEFSVIGLLLIVFALKQTVQKITQPVVCKVKTR